MHFLLSGGKLTGAESEKSLLKYSSSNFISRSDEDTYLTNGSNIDFNSPELELPAYPRDSEGRASFSLSGSDQPRHSRLDRRKESQVPLLDSSSRGEESSRAIIYKTDKLSNNHCQANGDAGRYPKSNYFPNIIGEEHHKQMRGNYGKSGSNGCVISNAFAGSSGRLREGRDESSTRTLDTLLSPSTSGQPHLMLVTGE